jgi:transposase-like protein
MTKPIVRDPIYPRPRFDAEIIELCVRWYITYRLSYRDLMAMMAERGIVVLECVGRTRVSHVNPISSAFNAPVLLERL